MTHEQARGRFHAAQEAAFRRLGTAAPPMTREAWLESLDSMQSLLLDQRSTAPLHYIESRLEELDAKRNRIHSLFDSGQENLLLDDFADHFDLLLQAAIATSDGLGLRCSTDLVIGTFPTGRLGARLLSPDEEFPDERYIVIDNGMPVFANVLSKAITRCFPIQQDLGGNRVRYVEDPEFVRQQMLNAANELVRPYAELIHAYVIEGTPLAATQRLVDPRWEPIAGSWRESIEFFIVSHEYAHAVLGVKPKLVQSERTDREFGRLLEWEMTRLDEFEADEIAARMLIAWRKRHGVQPSLALMPLYAFFHALHDLTYGICVLLEGSIEAGRRAFEQRYFNHAGGDGHPAPLERLKSVTAAFHRLAGDDLMHTLKRGELVEMVMSYFGGFVETSLTVMLNRKMRPHGKWKDGP